MLLGGFPTGRIAAIGNEVDELLFVHRTPEVIAFHGEYAEMGSELALLFRFNAGGNDADALFLSVGAEACEGGAVPRRRQGVRYDETIGFDDFDGEGGQAREFIALIIELRSDPFDGEGGKSLLQLFNSLCVLVEIRGLDDELDAVAGEMVLGEGPLDLAWEGFVKQGIKREVDGQMGDSDVFEDVIAVLGEQFS